MCVHSQTHTPSLSTSPYVSSTRQEFLGDLAPTTVPCPPPPLEGACPPLASTGPTQASVCGPDTSQVLGRPSQALRTSQPEVGAAPPHSASLGEHKPTCAGSAGNSGHCPCVPALRPCAGAAQESARSPCVDSALPSPHHGAEQPRAGICPGSQHTHCPWPSTRLSPL